MNFTLLTTLSIGIAALAAECSPPGCPPHSPRTTHSPTISARLEPICLLGGCHNRFETLLKPTDELTTTYLPQGFATSSSTANPITYASPIACEGRTTSHVQCPIGQKCYHGLDENTDLPGVCIGQTCGGFTPHPQYCPSKQACVRPVSDDASTANLAGHCVLETVVCAGAANRTCAEDWSCVVNPKWCSKPGKDCLGVCEPNDWNLKTINSRQPSISVASKFETYTAFAIDGSDIAARQAPGLYPPQIPCEGHTLIGNDAVRTEHGACPASQTCWHYPQWLILAYFNKDTPGHCIGRTCGGPNDERCPLEQECVRPVDGNAATADSPGRCTSRHLSCLDDSSCPKDSGWSCANQITSTCNLSGSANCSGLCTPKIWPSPTRPAEVTCGTCPRGQTCAHPFSKDLPEEKSVCIGESCDLSAATSESCPTNQICVPQIGGVDIPMWRSPGKCVSKMWSCGAGGPPCNEGWTCVADPTKGCELGNDACAGMCQNTMGFWKGLELGA